MTTPQLPAGWREITIQQLVDDNILAKPIDGNHGSIHPKSEDFVHEGVPFVMVADIVNGRVDYSSVKFITEEQNNTLRKGFSLPGDVLLSHKATVGLVALVGNERESITLTPQLTYYRVNNKDKLYNKYLYYYFQSSFFQNTLLSRSGGGSTRLYLGITDQRKLPIILPPLPEQVAIASLLSSFDDKIELLREQNKTLETLGQTIFQEWFGKYSVDNPESLPDGWRVGKITEIINRETISYRCTKKDLDDKGTTKIFDQGETGIYGYTSRKPDFKASKKNPVLLFTNHTCNYRFVDYSFCAIQNVIPYRGKNGYDEYFLYFMTKGSITIIEYKGHRPNFEAKDFIIPTTETAKEFSKIAKPLLQKISDNNSQIQSLAKTRDVMLPKLMSGEVRVEF